VNPLAAGSVALVAAIRFICVEGPPRDVGAPHGNSEQSERGGPSTCVEGPPRDAGAPHGGSERSERGGRSMNACAADCRSRTC
jgi:hypothetical protein